MLCSNKRSRDERLKQGFISYNVSSRKCCTTLTPTMSQRKKYTPGEDEALLAFVNANKRRYPPTGNSLWLLAETLNITAHSGQSMKARYELFTRSSANHG